MFKKKEKDKVALPEITALPASWGREIMPLATTLRCSGTDSGSFLSPGPYFTVTASTPHWHRHNLLLVSMFHILG